MRLVQHHQAQHQGFAHSVLQLISRMADCMANGFKHYARGAVFNVRMLDDRDTTRQLLVQRYSQFQRPVRFLLLFSWLLALGLSVVQRWRSVGLKQWSQTPENFLHLSVRGLCFHRRLRSHGAANQ